MSIIRRRSQQIVLTSFTFSTLALVSCDTHPVVYQSIQQCSADHDSDLCDTAYQLAYIKWTKQSGYSDAQDCLLGEHISCEKRDDNTYMPPMFGFTYADNNPVTISGRSQCEHSGRTDCTDSNHQYASSNNGALLFLFMYNGSTTTYVRRSSPSEISNFRSSGSMSSFEANQNRNAYGSLGSGYSYSSGSSGRAYTVPTTTTTTGGFGDTARSFSGGGGEGGEGGE